MKLSKAVRVALKALRANKLRSALTALGIIIGVASVVTMLALGRGAGADVENRVMSMGANLLTVRPGQMRRGPAFGGSVQTLTLEDAEAIQDECPSVAAVDAGCRGTAQLKWKSENTSTSITGASASYLEVNSKSMEQGSFFGAHDVRGSSRVCVVGQGVVEDVFGENDPIGQKVRIGTIPFTVIGALAETSGGGPFGDPNDIVIVPITVAMHRLFGRDYVEQIGAMAATSGSLDQAKSEITELLLRRHRIKSAEDADFHVTSQTDILDVIGGTSQTFTMLLASIAAVSLLVGGIGVMNIMLVSVTERTREIGIRKAVGARRADILRQFLIESLALCVLGGVVGAGLGAWVARIVADLASWPTLVKPDSIVVAILFSAGVGIGFGLYPARKAAKLDPIEALRYE
jgi:putative ABC transport system permease protein